MIEGSFKDVSLPALLHLLCFETAKSFRVTISDDNQKGFISIRRGWVIAAQFGLLEGEDAVCEFQSWLDGSFHAQQVAAQPDSDKNLRFEFQPNSGFINDCSILNEHHIGLNSELTGSRLFGSSEWKALVQEHPLDRECFSVLAWLREGRKMRQALREFGFDIVRATAILAMLVRTHSIEVIRPGFAAADQRREAVSDKNIPTTGGQQEAAASLAREAARALESATDVADEAFMSTSFKSPEFTESKANHRALDSQSSSYSLDTQSRSSMEARLRAKKNFGVHSASDLSPPGDKAFGKITGPIPALPKPMPPDVAASTSTSETAARLKKPKPDLFSVLQSRTGKVVPDLGTSTPQANSGQVTASTHNLPTLKQARLKTDKPELLTPDYADPRSGESANFNSIRNEPADSPEVVDEDEIQSYSWKGPSEPSPLSVNWPKNVPSNTFQNMPAQKVSDAPAIKSSPVDSETHLTPVDAANSMPKVNSPPILVLASTPDVDTTWNAPSSSNTASTPHAASTSNSAPQLKSNLNPVPISTPSQSSSSTSSTSTPTPTSIPSEPSVIQTQKESSTASATANPTLNQMLDAETEKSRLARINTSAETSATTSSTQSTPSTSSTPSTPSTPSTSSTPSTPSTSSTSSTSASGSGQSIPSVQGVLQPHSPTQAAANFQSSATNQPAGSAQSFASVQPDYTAESPAVQQSAAAPPVNHQSHPNARREPERVSTDLITDNDPRVVAKTDAMPVVAFDIERLLLTTFLATQFGKLALGNPSLDLHRRQTLMDAEYGKCLAVSIEDNTRLPSAVLASYRYCLERGYIETQDPVIPLTADLLLGRMEIDQYLLQRRRITGDELRDLIRVAREEGIKLTQLLVKSGYLTEADLETLGREQKRFAFK